MNKYKYIQLKVNAACDLANSEYSISVQYEANIKVTAIYNLYGLFG